MENQEILESNENATNDLIIDNYSKSNLATTATWAQILAIIGFIGIGFMIITSIFSFFSLNFLDDGLNGNEDINYFKNIRVIIPFIYIIIGFILFYPLQKLYEFSKFTRFALINNNQDELIKAFECQSKYFKFMGILSLIFISISLLATIGTFIFMLTMLK